jgi:hypothetical protein
LSDEYGFADVDDVRPHWWMYASKHFPQLTSGQSPTPYAWQISRASA